VLERAVDRFQHPAQRRRDGLADRRHDRGKQRIGELPRIAADERRNPFLDGRCQRPFELGIVVAELNSLREDLTDLARLRSWIVETGLERTQLPLLWADEQRAQFGEPP
jgi:hypothetical protein